MGHVGAAPAQLFTLAFAVGLDALGEVAEVGAGAERAPFARQDDRTDAVVVVPDTHRVDDFTRHGVGPGVEFALAVQADDADAVARFGEEFSVSHGERHLQNCAEGECRMLGLRAGRD